MTRRVVRVCRCDLLERGDRLVELSDTVEEPGHRHEHFARATGRAHRGLERTFGLIGCAPRLLQLGQLEPCCNVGGFGNRCRLQLLLPRGGGPRHSRPWVAGLCLRLCRALVWGVLTGMLVRAPAAASCARRSTGGCRPSRWTMQGFLFDITASLERAASVPATNYQLTVRVNRPSAHLPSAICHLPSAICHLSSAICHHRASSSCDGKPCCLRPTSPSCSALVL